MSDDKAKMMLDYFRAAEIMILSLVNEKKLPSDEDCDRYFEAQNAVCDNWPFADNSGPEKRDGG